MQDYIDHVFKDFRTGYHPIFGDMSNHQYGDMHLLGKSLQCGGTLTNLRYTARATINQIGLEGLYRIYNKEFGFECIGLDEDLLYIGFVEQKTMRIPIVHSVTSQLDLR